MSAAGKLITLGRISGAFGVKGWLKIQSYTEPHDNIVNFGAWTVCRGIERHEFAVEDYRVSDGGVVAKLGGVDDRDQARLWTGALIAVERQQLPPCEPGEYYWTDLEGLEVRTMQGERLGTVERLLPTGAHAVLVLGGERERLIPFVWDEVIRDVDLDAGVILADWAKDY